MEFQQVDLREISQLENALVNTGIDFTVPTLFLAECVLMYMLPQQSDNLIQWTAQKFSNACFIAYEQMLPYVNAIL